MIITNKTTNRNSSSNNNSPRTKRIALLDRRNGGNPTRHRQLINLPMKFFPIRLILTRIVVTVVRVKTSATKSGAKVTR